MQKKNEATSVTAASRESEPGGDERAGPPRLTGFRQDADGHWVALLSCGHTQHLRHQPPWQNRPWVLDPEHRRRLLGQPFPCGWCLKERLRED
ncbi:DUF3565 domain-containing protein [Azotobacter chroococcum]|nr:DUF3565 domain-containing protein [Azotobacter chroococcum]